MRNCPDPVLIQSLCLQDCMIGLAFASESEASELFKKISMRHKYAAKYNQASSSGGGGSSTAIKSPSKSKKKKGGIDKSMIGAPSGFNHVAHMGFDSEKGFTSNNIDPSWERLLSQLESQGISRVSSPFFSSTDFPTHPCSLKQTQILKNETFIRNYVEGSGGPNAAPPPPAAASSGPAFAPRAPSSRAPAPPPPSSSKRVPPPAPPSRTPGGHTVKRKPPPAPASRNSVVPPPPTSSVPPPPPPPPARGNVPPPPPPPAMRGNVPPPPPPPPARGAGNSHFLSDYS